MGSAVGEKCLDTAAAAAAYECATRYPIVQGTANGCYFYTHSCTASAATPSITILRTSPAYVAATGCAAQAATTQSLVHTRSYAACNPLEQYQDVSSIWGLGILGGVTAWAMKAFIWRLVANH